MNPADWIKQHSTMRPSYSADWINLDFGAVKPSEPGGPELRLDRLPPHGFGKLVKEYGIRQVCTVFKIGDPPGNLDFLRELPGVDGLVLNGPWRLENSDLERIANLRILRTSCVPLRQLDLSQFKDLEVFNGRYNPMWQNLGGCSKLWDLRMKHAPDEYLPEIAKMPSLRRVLLEWGKFTSLDFLKGCPSLETVDLWSCNKAAAARTYPVNPNLKYFWVNGGRSLGNLDWVASFPNLESINLENCGQIESFRPLASLERMRHIMTRGSTEAVDGDVRCLAGLKFDHGPHITFKPHYNATRKEMKELAGWFSKKPPPMTILVALMVPPASGKPHTCLLPSQQPTCHIQTPLS